MITQKLRDPQGPQGAGLAHADGIGDSLRHCRHLKTAVEKEAEPIQIALGILFGIESMASAAETRFQVAQQDIDPAKLGEIIGVTPTGYHSSVAAACCDDRAEASAEFGAQLLLLRQQLFEHWHQWKAGAMDWLALQRSCQPIRLAFEQTLQRVVELGCQKGEQSPWGKTVRTCQQLANQKQALWTFLEHPGIEPTNNAAERALRPAVIQRKISHGVQSAKGALCRSRLLTVTTTLRQQGRDVWDFLEQAWIAHHHGGVMPSLLPDP